MQALLSIDEYVQGILKGNIAILSKAITLIESNKLEHKTLASELLNKIIPHTGKSVRVGITGVPGVGKSSFIESYGLEVINQNHKVAVLAIDPSSKLNGGSILGDKTRMEKLSMHQDAYIRPSPSSGELGGVANKTRESILLCEAAGYDYILIETVGVGQSEVEVRQLSDYFLLLMLAGAGDELQGIKRGIMEMADGLVFTKADGTNFDKANQARAEFANAVHHFPAKKSGVTVQVKTTSSLTKSGIKEVYDLIQNYCIHTKASGFFEENRKEQSLFWFHKLINDKLIFDFYTNTSNKEKIKQLEKELFDKNLSPYDLLSKLFK